ncbi:MAG: maleylacetoacetate isomerase [Alphaproteobacteria bacterium]
MKLYNYFRSGTSYRTRIVLNLKGLKYEYVPVSLLKGAQHSAEFDTINPMHAVPVLEIDGVRIAQSPAIIEYLEETYPDPPLLPKDPADRAHVRALAAIVGCDMHPLNNLRVLNYLREEFGQHSDGVIKWAGNWLKAGFDAYERLIAADKGRNGFSFGPAPTIADAYLVPQVFSAERFKFDISAYPEIRTVVESCNRLAAFADAHPSKQPDAE